MAQSPQSEPTTAAANARGSTIGIEIAESGTRLATALAIDGAIVGRQQRRLSAPPSPEEAVAAINTLVEQVLTANPEQRGQFGALGIAFWGSVDPWRGVTLGMPQCAGWEDFELTNQVASHWEVPVFLHTAVAAAGLAEATVGAGRHRRVVLYMHSGRTVASAFIVDGSIVPDASGRAGNLAHWLVLPDGPRCVCGMHGHLDPIASAQSIVRATIGLASGSDESTAAMLRVSGGRAEAMTVRQIVQLAAEGDPAAETVLERAWDALAVVLANLVAALDPDVIVLGGPSAEAGEGFLNPLRERLAVLCAPWRLTPEIVPETLGPRSALIGACLLPHLRGGSYSRG